MHPSYRTCVDKIRSTDRGQADGQGKTNISTKTSFAESIEIDRND